MKVVKKNAPVRRTGAAGRKPVVRRKSDAPSSQRTPKVVDAFGIALSVALGPIEVRLERIEELVEGLRAEALPFPGMEDGEPRIERVHED